MAAMSPGVRDILLDGGCLTEIDVLLGREFWLPGHGWRAAMDRAVP